MSKNMNDKTKQNKKHQMFYIPQKTFLAARVKGSANWQSLI